MPLEVEVKYANVDLVGTERALRELPVSELGCREEVDLYFAHPARDFACTDEALRIRRVGERNFLAYKGPKLDPLSKTRDEVELALPEGPQTWEKCKTLLEKLGFRPVAEVCKTRKKFHLLWEDWQVEISLDDVRLVGQFVELEIICGEHELVRARDALLRLATRLGLQHSERRSYLELLLQKNDAGRDRS